MTKGKGILSWWITFSTKSKAPNKRNLTTQVIGPVLHRQKVKWIFIRKPNVVCKNYANLYNEDVFFICEFFRCLLKAFLSDE